ncbi:MAG: PRTRC system protein E [Pseudomonadota bacterium]
MMTMFQELYALATSATLTMIVSADEKSGKLTISVLPKPRKDAGEVALTKDLTLTASPEDFDAGFVQALQGYREARATLNEQAEATREALKAATALCAKRATEATKKVSMPSPTTKQRPAVTSAESEEYEGDVEGKGSVQAPNPQAVAPAPALGESLPLFG